MTIWFAIALLSSAHSMIAYNLSQVLCLRTANNNFNMTFHLNIFSEASRIEFPLHGVYLGKRNFHSFRKIVFRIVWIHCAKLSWTHFDSTINFHGSISYDNPTPKSLFCRKLCCIYVLLSLDQLSHNSKHLFLINIR